MTKKDIDNLLQKGERIIMECKKALNGLPKSVWETYSAFANTNGGTILLGIEENLTAAHPSEAFTVLGVNHPQQIIKDFWNTVNNPQKVNVNLLTDSDVDTVNYNGKILVTIRVPQADYRIRPVYINNNPISGTYKRNHEGDYHCSEKELRYMYRDADDNGNDGILLENYTMDDLDPESIRAYRQLFTITNDSHIWNDLDNKEFLIKIGAFDTDRSTGHQWLTMAGLLMFGKGLAIRNRFSYLRMDYIDTTNLIGDSRWSDRLTYDGRWENNLYNFFTIVLPKLTFDLKRPFQLEGLIRTEETLVHKAVREAFTNQIIHSDFCLEGILKVVKKDLGFEFSNPGLLKIPADKIYQGSYSRCRNPRLQNMFRMIGYGENIGSGWTTILKAWEESHWKKPVLIEHHDLIMVELKLDLIAETTREPISEQLSEQLEQILAEISKNKEITREQLSEQLNIPYATIRRRMDTLVKMGILKREGGNKNGHWLILKK